MFGPDNFVFMIPHTRLFLNRSIFITYTQLLSSVSQVVRHAHVILFPLCKVLRHLFLMSSLEWEVISYWILLIVPLYFFYHLDIWGYFLTSHSLQVQYVYFFYHLEIWGYFMTCQSLQCIFNAFRAYLELK